MSFEAKYPGFCEVCMDRIYAGEEVDYVNDVLVHAVCDEAEPDERPTVTCTECWLIKPCPCDDAS